MIYGNKGFVREYSYKFCFIEICKSILIRFLMNTFNLFFGKDICSYNTSLFLIFAFSLSKSCNFPFVICY